jgi:hypothetical protein
MVVPVLITRCQVIAVAENRAGSDPCNDHRNREKERGWVTSPLGGRVGEFGKLLKRSELFTGARGRLFFLFVIPGI